METTAELLTDALQSQALAVRVQGWADECWVASEFALPYVHLLPDDDQAYVVVAPWIDQDGSVHQILWQLLARRVTTAVMRQPGVLCWMESVCKGLCGDDKMFLPWLMYHGCT